jgi:hypothetical protein
MTIYFAGTEDVDFTLAGTAIGSTTGPFDAALRGNILMNTSNAAWPPTSYATNPVSLGNLSSFWFHCGFVSSASGVGQILNTIPFAFADAAGVARLLIRNTGNVGQFKISTRNAAGTIVDLVTGTNGAFGQAVLVKIDIFVNYSATGRVIIYANGVNICDTGASINVTTDGATSLSFFYLTPCQTNVSNNNFSEVIVADIDTRSMKLWLLNSATSGTLTQWTGTATNVNKAVIADGTFVTSPTAGQINDYKTGGITVPTGSWIVRAVVTSMRALASVDAGPQHVQSGFNFNGTRYWSSSYAPGAAFGNFPNLVWPTNPNTAAAWTIADVTAATFNYGVQSIA